MIDLIIPYYKNYEGLLRTLESINYNVFKVTVVEDGCNEIFPDCINYPITLIHYDENHGPGYARQVGIKHTSNKYLAFIDTGDIFISKEIQEEIIPVIKENHSVDVFCWLYYYKDELTKHTDNRMHGKIYKRKFIKKHNITFCPESSYMDEDVGFNRACRLLTEFMYIDTPIIKWISNDNSLTQKDNSVVLYRDQTRALALNALHAIKIGKENKIDVNTEINQIAIALYYWFLKTVTERPQYIQEAWSGARIFYTELQNEIVPSNLALGNPEIKRCLQYNGKVHFSINILRFAHDIQQYEEIPKNYLGGD